ncbi:MAG: hypothetical protein HKP30_06145 [Myxococcales bacterium]|nr:hypothetical protein [Myxococcales bacterium]
MDVACPWLEATLVFWVLVGAGRTLRGDWLAHPPFGAGVALSAGIGLLVFSLLWFGLGHAGWIARPWPWVVLGLGILLALPGLWWTVADGRAPVHGLERGFGPRWLAGPAWLLLLTTLLVSAVWISGAFDWPGRGFLFETAGVDHAVGAIAAHGGRARDVYLGNEPIDLWLFGLGSPEASLAFAWWLGVALLFGVCGMAWRLHAHGAGLLAATVLALALFISDRPLFLAPALPAAVALLAMMILAVESRGRPHVGRTLVAGALGGYALISDLGSIALLLPLLLFGPTWCKLAGSEPLGRIDSPEPEPAPPARAPEPELGDAALGDLDGALKSGAKKWGVPLRHTFLGVAGLGLTVAPWVAVNEYAYGEPDYCYPDDGPALDLGWGYPHAPRLADYDAPFGTDWLDDLPVVDDVLCALEWGFPIVALALFAPWYGWRRMTPALYVGPGLVSYGVGGALSDFELVHPATLSLLSVGAGSTLYTWRGCREPRRSLLGFGPTLATGGLALGLSTAYDCGYWDDFDDYEEWTPRVALRYDLRVEDESLGFRYELDPDVRFDLHPTVLHELEPEIRRGLQYEVEPEPSADPGFQLRVTPTEEGGLAVEPRERPGLSDPQPDIRPGIDVDLRDIRLPNQGQQQPYPGQTPGATPGQNPGGRNLPTQRDLGRSRPQR